MKKAIILHGNSDKLEYYDPAFPSASNSHWIPWLQRQLQVKGVNAQTPEVHNGWGLEYENWCKEFERFGINEDTALIGHSCGGGFIVRWLSEHPDVKVDKVTLVAPWIDPDKEYSSTFFDFEIKRSIATQTKGIMVYVSDDEPHESVAQSVEILRKSVDDIVCREFQNYGHFCLSDMGTVEFPELRDHLLEK